MKKLFLLSLVTGGCPALLQAQQAMVALDKMNILYAGVPNPVSILVSGYKPEDVKMEMDKVVINRVDPVHYIFTPNAPGSVTLKIYGKEKIIESYTYRVKTIPAPTVTLAGISDEGKISRQELLAQIGLVSSLNGFDYNVPQPVSQYRVRVFRDGHKLADQSFANGPKFTAEYNRMVNEVQVGDVIVFSEIQCLNPQNGQQKSLNPYISVEIK
ncbi:GldM family protein [Edaphocola aurantiacus]|uniref:GldM family protein n=1 Tax=Edaphocola aurantiacus TaxID=2601682 RepID=UPI001C9856F5|nr:GldM family protein [Edaphocola aurantiacus]